MSTDFVGRGAAAPSGVPANETPLAKARRKLALWEAAEDALATSQEYRMADGRSLTRASLPQVQKMVAYYQSEVSRIAAGRGRGARVMRIVPYDS